MASIAEMKNYFNANYTMDILYFSKEKIEEYIEQINHLGSMAGIIHEEEYEKLKNHDNLTYEKLEEYFKEEGLDINNLLTFDTMFPSDSFVYMYEGIPMVARLSKDKKSVSMLKEICEEVLDFIEGRDESNYRICLHYLNSYFKVDYLCKVLPSLKNQEVAKEIFWDLYGSGTTDFDMFNKELIKRYKNVEQNHINKLKKLTDTNGYITIYRGQNTTSTDIEKTYSWTIDVNIAIQFAYFNNLEGAKIFEGKIHVDNILAYLSDRKESEIVCFYEDVHEIKKLNTVAYEEFIDDDVFLEEYRIYRGRANGLKEFEGLLNSDIHGITHVGRVLLLTLSICKKEHIAARDKEILLNAALFHDIGRVHDNRDDKHGLRSAKMRKERYPNLTSITNKERLFILDKVIEYHSQNDKSVECQIKKLKVSDYLKGEISRLTWLFKDIDALDRLRIKDLKLKFIRNKNLIKYIGLSYEYLKYIK